MSRGAKFLVGAAAVIVVAWLFSWSFIIKAAVIAVIVIVLLGWFALDKSQRRRIVRRARK